VPWVTSERDWIQEWASRNAHQLRISQTETVLRVDSEIGGCHPMTEMLFFHLATLWSTDSIAKAGTVCESRSDAAKQFKCIRHALKAGKLDSFPRPPVTLLRSWSVRSRTLMQRPPLLSPSLYEVCASCGVHACARSRALPSPPSMLFVHRRSSSHPPASTP
jgi:hypothetical protein